MKLPEALEEAFNTAASTYDKLTTPQKYAVGIAGGLVSIRLMSSLISFSSDYKRKPTSFDLSGGSIESSKVKAEFDAYNDAYGKDPAQGIKDRSKTAQLVDVFYSLVTDFYEWGWGQSFHFSPKLPAKDWKQSEVAHESRIAAVLGLKPGMKCLDCGCGVGGPLRTIASVSGAHVTGITINEYQVSRARYHNEKQGVAPLATIVRGDFLNMPFQPNTFDAAYAIEATCHAPKLEDVYGQIYKVLKPGALFVTYEWVATDKFNPNNPEHVRIIDEINYGNGLPEMRTRKEAEAAGLNTGFELVTSLDLATSSAVTGPWYNRLWLVLKTVWINKSIVNTMHLLGLMPNGMKAVHDMLVYVAKSLVRGGETGIFSPMHMLVFRKPSNAK
ncbi:hypothetical protein CEUSTIGMA_g4396.t1 [Chlamydomonas eustigma]|uniref:Methyltransferase n=1 Tax=Chlamydomonas eustigma TaxID=1157962 RepID=A0A250X1Y7_9CHLO|nr:hypothetical protein CEUSTIGMA_g4396.t1 [Chlamydomonas eustigma]|eukprot:GAX76949.1 hypothetical protein CEUSTIGMA_g4396.t1 [Chlamydomonas eustigma]